MTYKFYRIYPQKIVFKTYEDIYDVADFAVYLSRKYKRPVILNVSGTKIGLTPSDGILLNKDSHVIKLYNFAKDKNFNRR